MAAIMRPDGTPGPEYTPGSPWGDWTITPPIPGGVGRPAPRAPLRDPRRARKALMDGMQG